VPVREPGRRIALARGVLAPAAGAQHEAQPHAVQRSLALRLAG
jgi:hypothetical protein